MTGQFVLTSLTLFVIFFTPIGHSESVRKITVESKLDKYDLILSSKTSGTIDGRPADLKALQELWPIFDYPLGNTCPELSSQSDATITESGKVRIVYLQDGIVSDGTSCLNVNGEGLSFFPIHRDFLIGSKQGSIKVESPLKIFRQGVKFLELKRNDKDWVSLMPDLILNWDFIRKLEKALSSYPVNSRLTLNSTAKSQMKMILQSGMTTYEFFKLSPTMWALKKPGVNWLVSSNDWSSWGEFDLATVEDPNASEIRALQKTDNSLKEREQAMQKIESFWSNNLRTLYEQLAIRESEDMKIRETALKRLKTKPSIESCGTMVQIINSDDPRNENLKSLATQVLKIQNPSGPLYKSSLPPKSREKVVTFWNQWWKKKQTKP